MTAAAARHIFAALLAVVSLSLSFGTYAQQILLTRDSKRDCATCHTDWADSFERPGALLLMDKPAKPAAAAEETCRGCHDGSVGDSRRDVWLEHGHRLNEKPTDKIKVPANMPLDEGKMVCRTCHTAHTVPTANDLSRIVFLRAATEGGLCQQCHVDRVYGAEHTSHPLAKLPFELPKELFKAHARMDIADRSKMACQTCHTAHGARQEHLLVMATDSSQLCVTCHSKLRPEEWRMDKPHEHPQNPPLKTEGQKRAIAAMGTKLGPGDTLICLSCHKMHDAKTGKVMLADTLQDSALCIRCHEDRKIVLSSKHDLRKTKPEELNRLKQTPEQSGPCGACHSFHQYAREPAPGRGDPAGLCISCHQPKGAGAEKGLAFAHPPDVSAAKVPEKANLRMIVDAAEPAKRSFECTTCHDPHDASKTLFLRQTKDQICGTCHADRFATVGGKHDFSAKPELKNARGQTAELAGKCGFCHAVHGETDLVMWAGTNQQPNGPDDLCLQCHRKEGLAHDKPAALFSHPTGPKALPTTRPGESVRLFNEHGRIDAKGFVACSSCHDPHADSTKQPAMLRVASPTSNLCRECHAENALLAGGAHDAREKKDWPAKEKNADLCTSCHRPHSNDAATGRFTMALAAGVPKADGACIACHPKNAWATAETAAAVGRSMHPTTVPAGQREAVKRTGLPLVASVDGKDAVVGCKTCHNPHAPPGTVKLVRGATAGNPASAMCQQCHADARGLGLSLHGAEALAAGGKDPRHGAAAMAAATADRACSPCHAAHAVEGSRREMLWAGAIAAGRSQADGRCLSCHEAKADPQRPLVVKHPEAPLKTLDWAKTPAALASRAEGALRCGTCHAAHGDLKVEEDAPASAEGRRAAKPMIRADAREQCAYCHGGDARRLLLYWHYPQKRGSNLEVKGR